MSRFKILALIASAAFLSACIWGEGSENSPVFYNGKTTPTIITAENSKEVAINGLSNQSLGGAGAILGGAEISGNEDISGKTLKISPIPASIRAAQLIRIVTNKYRSLDVPAVSITGAVTTVAGSCGGTETTTSSETDSNFSATFDDYCDGGADGKFVISGSMSLSSDEFTFSQLRMRSPGFDMSMNGSMNFTSNLGNSSGAFSFVTNMDFRNNLTGEVGRLENYTVTANVDSDNFYMEVSGRVYHSTYGYVDIETITPISFDFVAGNLSGKMKFTGQNSSVTLEFLGNDLFRITTENGGRVVAAENLSFEDIFSAL